MLLSMIDMLHMSLQLASYFLAGLVIAAISTFNVKMIGKGNATAATIGSFGSTFIGMSVVVTLAQEMSKYGLYGILAYCVGVSIGTYFIVMDKKGDKMYK